jgi:hypothetical protein
LFCASSTVCPSAAHVDIAGMHAAPLQVKPLAQSVSAAHVVLQPEAPSHAKLPAHVAGGCAMHAPELLQVLVVKVPLAQLDPHGVPLVYAQAVLFAPSHVPSHAVPAPLHAPCAPCGAPVIVLHVPIDPATSHASHCPVHAVAQQMSSTQKPPFAHAAHPALLQSVGEHACPAACCAVHVPFAAQ